MASQLAILARTRSGALLGGRLPFKSISTSTFLSQEAQLAEPPHDTSPHPSEATALPPNPATGSPIYSTNWRNPIPVTAATQSVIPMGLVHQVPPQFQTLPQPMDATALLNVLAGWMASQRWHEIKQLFEFWVSSLDRNGKLNRPDVSLYNLYLRANLMMGATAGQLLDLLAQMDEFALVPNTASFNLVLKAMYHAHEIEAAGKLIERMLQTAKDSGPDAESYDLIIHMMFQADKFDAALRYFDLALKSGCTFSMRLFNVCVSSCLAKGKLDTLVSIIERCKAMDQTKALSPNWNTCKEIADVAMREDNSRLTFFALEYIARWIARGENARPQIHLSVDEGLVVSALATAGRTYSSTLLDASWAILGRSLREKKAPNPETYLAKICAHALVGNLQRAFAALSEFETTYGNSESEVLEELLSPFTSLNPLVVACSKKGFETLDSVYFQLEHLSQSNSPYKSVAALNCIILGCANTWDLDRAYQTFEAIGSTFGLTPNIHSYNALMCAFGKLKKTLEASRVFEHLTSLGVKPNATSYLLLVDAHLINRDPKGALAVIDEMVNAGFVPSKEALKKVRRRCIREMDYESDDRVESLAKQFGIRMGLENRRNILFDLQYSTEYA